MNGWPSYCWRWVDFCCFPLFPEVRGRLQEPSRACILSVLSIGGAAYLGFDETSFTDDSIFTFFKIISQLTASICL